ncbi:MAG: Gfo/Idh/MocA family oxidoreductase [Candidatus Omnitrophica bacterium]|nr:Gfo/Idh/MocA family oxidoreductase [Candidatus Omnitrophota bacterium]
MAAEGRSVLLVGCGQMGSRHLQAVACLGEVVAQVQVVDPNPRALQLGRERLKEISSERTAAQEIRWLGSIRQVTGRPDLCIVATHAKDRERIVQAVAEETGVRAFLLEKIVTQTVEAYEALIRLSRERELSVWVDCQGRGHPFHRQLKQLFKTGEPVSMAVTGGNHGLATNGVHAADLFAFYSQASEIQEAGSNVDPILHPSKRGGELFDLSGTLRGFTKNGSQFTLTYHPGRPDHEHFSIASPSVRCVADHLQQWAALSEEASGWVWRPMEILENFWVSRMTRQFAREILRTGRCDLPTLEEAFAAHRFILESLRPHFNQLLNEERPLCPVT